MASLYTMRQLTRQAPAAPTRAQCCRALSSAAPLQSGHNKWSKIKHEKAAADLKISRQRSFFVRNLAVLSKRASPHPPRVMRSP